MSELNSFDVIIYGATSAGIVASLQVARMGKTVLLIGTTNRVGGLTTNGLGQTDIGNKEIFGGISREFYQRVRRYYEAPSAWQWQQPEDYRDGGQSTTEANEDARWTFEPRVALAVFKAMLTEAKIPLVLDQQLDRKGGVTVVDGRIRMIRMCTGECYKADAFIDATYEGDLMAAAGVSYTVGREANSAYGETVNGIQTLTHGRTLLGGVAYNAEHHQLMSKVDPYVRAGDSSSGLLPGIDPYPPGEIGSADDLIQAYCFRLCLTDHPGNRIPFDRPENYDSLEYELLLRNIESGETMIPLIHSSMPNRKTDSNNRRGVSTDYIGQNYRYPEASSDERKIIFQKHLEYTQGLMWTLAHNLRVPESMRLFFNEWGLCRDEFVETGGWPAELYVREARRLCSDYVMTQSNCEGITDVPDPVGMAAYMIDSHHVCRYVGEDGFAHNEGNVQAAVNAPYSISYRSIIPRRGEIENLVIPVCLSATHVAFGSIRMEPIFMVLGQSAATAAVLALSKGIAVQNLAYPELHEQLVADGQVLRVVISTIKDVLST